MAAAGPADDPGVGGPAATYSMERQFVEQLRHDRLPLATNKIFATEYENMGKHISLNAYKDSGRVVFELLQNCEDAPFTPKDLKKAVVMVTLDGPEARAADVPLSIFQDGSDGKHGLLIVASNEDGFSESNVESLCRTAMSDKGDEVVEPIPGVKYKRRVGEKGIGFKSVFGVSDSPHIISRGFTFRFKPKSETNRLSTVMPYWIEKDEGVVSWARDYVNNILDLGLGESRGSILLLPLKEGKFDVVSKSVKVFAEDPDSILFLLSTKHIAVQQREQSKAVRREMQIRHEKSLDAALDDRTRPATLTNEGLPKASESEAIRSVSIRTIGTKVSEECDWLDVEWLKVDMFFATNPAIKEEGRDLCTCVPVSLAFPLTSEKQEDVIRNGRLYAYLPTGDRDTHLPCLVNADFVMGTSRETFSTDNNQWNFYIVNEIFPQAYVTAFRRLVSHLLLNSNNNNDGDSLAARAKVVLGALPPMPKATSTAFRNVLGPLSDKLQTIAFIPKAHERGFLAHVKGVVIAPPQVHSVIVSHRDVEQLGFRQSFAHKSIFISLEELKKTRSDMLSLRVPAVWSAQTWKAVVSKTEWVEQHSSDWEWFVKLYSAILLTSSSDLEYASIFTSAPIMLCQSGKMDGMPYYIHDDDNAWATQFTKRNAGLSLMTIVHDTLWRRLGEEQVTLPGQQDSIAIAKVLKRINVVKRFSLRSYLPIIFEHWTKKPKERLPAKFLELVNMACKLILGNLQRDADDSTKQAEARKLRILLFKLPWFNASCQQIPTTASALRPASVSSHLEDLFDWSYVTSEGLLLNPAVSDIAQRVIAATYIDAEAKPWEEPLPATVTQKDLADLLFDNDGILQSKTQGKPGPPTNISTQEDLESIFPWLNIKSPFWSRPGRDQRALKQEYTRLYTFFIHWLSEVRAPGIQWKDKLCLVPRQHPDFKLAVGKELWIASPLSGDLGIDSSLLFQHTQHVHESVLDLANILVQHFGVQNLSSLPRSGRCVQVAKWIIDAVKTTNDAAFHSAAMAFLAKEIPTWNKNSSAECQGHLSELVGIFTLNPLIRVDSIAQAAGDRSKLGSLQQLNRDKWVLVPHVAEQGMIISPLQVLETHQVWSVLPKNTVEMWTMTSLGQDQYNVLRGIGVSEQIKPVHLLGVLRSCAATFSDGTSHLQAIMPGALDIRDFVWTVYSLLAGFANGQAILPANERLILTGSGEWVAASSLYWDSWASTFGKQWRSAAAPNSDESEQDVVKSQVNSIIWSTDVGTKNLYNDAEGVSLASKLEPLMFPLMKRFTKTAVVTALLEALKRYKLTAPATSCLLWTLYATASAALSQPELHTLRNAFATNQFDCIFVGDTWQPLSQKFNVVLNMDCRFEDLPQLTVLYAKHVYDMAVRPHNIQSLEKPEWIDAAQDFFGDKISKPPLWSALSKLLAYIHSDGNTNWDPVREEVQWNILYWLIEATSSAERVSVNKELKDLQGLLVNGIKVPWSFFRWFNLKKCEELVNGRLGLKPSSASSSSSSDFVDSVQKVCSETLSAVAGPLDLQALALRHLPKASTWRLEDFFVVRDKEALVRRESESAIVLMALQQLKKQALLPLDDVNLAAAWVLLDASFQGADDAFTDKLALLVRNEALFAHHGAWHNPSDGSLYPGLRFLSPFFGTMCFKLSRNSLSDKLGKLSHNSLNDKLDELYQKHTAAFNVTTTAKKVAKLLNSDDTLAKKACDALFEQSARLLTAKFDAVPIDVHWRVHTGLASQFKDADLPEVVTYASKFLLEMHKHGGVIQLEANLDKLHFSSVHGRLVPIKNLVLDNNKYQLTRHSEDHAEVFIAALPDATDDNGSAKGNDASKDALVKVLGDAPISMKGLDEYFTGQEVQIDLDSCSDVSHHLTGEGKGRFYFADYAGELFDSALSAKGYFSTLFRFLRSARFVKIGKDKMKHVLHFGALGDHTNEKAQLRWFSKDQDVQAWLSEEQGIAQAFANPSIKVEFSGEAPSAASSTIFFASAFEEISIIRLRQTLLNMMVTLVTSGTSKDAFKFDTPEFEALWKRWTDVASYCNSNEEASARAAGIAEEGPSETYEDEVSAPTKYLVSSTEKKISWDDFAVPILDLSNDDWENCDFEIVKRSAPVPEASSSFVLDLAGLSLATPGVQSSSSQPTSTVSIFAQDAVSTTASFTSSGYSSSPSRRRSGGHSINGYHSPRINSNNSPGPPFYGGGGSGVGFTFSAPVAVSNLSSSFSSSSRQVPAVMEDHLIGSNHTVSSDRIVHGLASLALSAHMSNINKIGRRGEEIAKSFLHKMFQPESDYEIVWENEHGETGKPYDYTVRHRNTSREIFVEIKASAKAGSPFWWSRNEYEFAAAKGPSYMLVHFTNLDGHCQVTVASNPVQRKAFVLDRMLAYLISDIKQDEGEETS